MRKGWKMCLLAVAVAMMGGCNQMDVQQNGRTSFEMIRDQFEAQQAYEFYGRTKLLTDNSANGNIVNFSGRKDGDAVFMNVKLSDPEQNRAHTISLLDQGGARIYAKQENDREWKTAGGQEAALRQELNNWDPAFAFSQMDEMRQSVTPVRDEKTGGDMEAIQVVLDSAKLKQWLAGQLKEQSGTQIQSAAVNAIQHRPSVKLALTLSTGRSVTGDRNGVSVQSTSIPDISEVVNRMDVEAAYTIYYRKSSMLPTYMKMTIRSAYDYNDQRIQEHSQVETYLQDYGKVQPVPKP